MEKREGRGKEESGEEGEMRRNRVKKEWREEIEREWGNSIGWRERKKRIYLYI